MLKKIGIIGAGYIGGVLAQEIAERKLAKEVGVVDPAPIPNPSDPADRQAVVAKQSVSIGKALDIAEGLPTIGSDTRLVASKDYSALKGSELAHQYRRHPAQGASRRDVPEPRGAARHQPEADPGGRGRHQADVPRRNNHFHREPAGRDRVRADQGP